MPRIRAFFGTYIIAMAKDSWYAKVTKKGRQAELVSRIQGSPPTLHVISGLDLSDLACVSDNIILVGLHLLQLLIILRQLFGFPPEAEREGTTHMLRDFKHALLIFSPQSEWLGEPPAPRCHLMLNIPTSFVTGPLRYVISMYFNGSLMHYSKTLYMINNHPYFYNISFFVS